jgi:hypothetical protein
LVIWQQIICDTKAPAQAGLRIPLAARCDIPLRQALFVCIDTTHCVLREQTHRDEEAKAGHRNNTLTL